MGQWKLRLSKSDFNVVNHGGVNNQTSNALYRLMFTGENQTLTVDDTLIVLLELQTDQCWYMRLVLYMTTTSDEASISISSHL